MSSRRRNLCQVGEEILKHQFIHGTSINLCQVGEEILKHQFIHGTIHGTSAKSPCRSVLIGVVAHCKNQENQFIHGTIHGTSAKSPCRSVLIGVVAHCKNQEINEKLQAKFEKGESSRARKEKVEKYRDLKRSFHPHVQSFFSSFPRDLYH